MGDFYNSPFIILIDNIRIIVGYTLLAIFVMFAIANWLFEKYDIRKRDQEKQRREFYAKWRTIRR